MLPEAINLYISSVAFDSSSLFEIFTFSVDALYFIKYTKSTLEISAFKKYDILITKFFYRFAMVGLIPRFVSGLIIGTKFNLFFTSKQFGKI